MRSRSAHSLPLVRYYLIHCVGRGCAPFSSAHSFVVPSGEGGGDDGVAVLRFVPRPVLRSVFSFRLYVHCSLFIHAVASRRRQRFSHLSRLPACLVPRSVKSSAPLPVASLTAFVFAHPSRPSSRPASRRPSRSHVVSPHRPVLIPSCLARCAERIAARLAVAPFCSARLSVLLMPCRPLVASWMTQDGNRYRITPMKRASNERTSSRERAAYLSG